MKSRSPVEQIGIEVTNARYDYPYANEIRSIHYPEAIAFQPGTLATITGHSGVGKSAFLHCLALVDRFGAGCVQYGPSSIQDMSESQLSKWRAKHIGIAFQHHHLIAKKCVLANVELPLRLLSLASVCPEAAESALARVNLTHRALSYPSTLSGGERSRAALARAIVHEPAILLCDEPTAGLDRISAQILVDLLKQEAARGATVVVVTHDPRLVEAAEIRYDFDRIYS